MKKSLQLVQLLLVAGAIIPYCTAYSSGAPSDACSSLNPSGHGGSTVGNTPPPYTFTVTQMNGQPVDTYAADQELKVTMTPTSTTFRGFLVKARRADPNLNQNDAIGTFTVADSNIMKETCQGTLGNALTHKKIDPGFDKSAALELTWKAPAQLQGHLEFVITVVRTRPQYWTFKATPNVITDPTAPALTGVQITTDNNPITLSDCESDSSKGCFTRPNKCTSGCDVAVTWKPEGNKIRFEMSSKLDYAALAFSTDKTMGNDNVVECVRNTGTGVVKAGNSKNVGYSNQNAAPYTAGITAQKNGYANGEVLCKFLHDGIDGGFKVGDTTGYYLFLAAGSSSGDSKNKHTDIPLISDSMVKVADGKFVGGSLSKPWLIKIHGAVMVIAWIACASIGILMARYYKDVWSNSTLLSQKVWFTIHRSLMVSVLLLTIIGIVVIFVHVKGWSDLETADPKILKAHPYVGIAVTVLAIINPIMAVFRPHPGESNRVYFNWAHWGVGTLAHVVSIFTVFLGLSLPSAEGVAPDYLIWVMVAFVAFHVLVDIVLEVHKCTAKSDKGGNNMEMQQMGQGGKSDSSNGETFRKMVLVVYVLVVVALAATVTIVVLSQ